MIPRTLEARIRHLARQMPAVTVTGPRQSGKTTLCRSVFEDRPYQNLELPDIRRFAEEDPRGFLASMSDGGVIDEAQRVPELFSYLQVDIDEHRDQHGRWILSGSHNFLLLESITESLAGRTAVTHLLPLELGEWRAAGRVADHWMDQALRGGFPILADESIDRETWLSSYIATYVERDVRQISEVGDLTTFQRFLELCAGRSGQDWSSSSLASDTGVSRATVDRWLSILEASFVVFRVRPFHRNVRKRVVKRSRLHFVDTGLLCALLGIHDRDQLARHPLRGAIFETWVVGEMHRALVHRGRRVPLEFYRDQHGVEIDVILTGEDRSWLVEAKSGATVQPDMAKNLKRVRAVLPEEFDVECTVVYGGAEASRRRDVEVVPWARVDDLVLRATKRSD